MTHPDRATVSFFPTTEPEASFCAGGNTDNLWVTSSHLLGLRASAASDAVPIQALMLFAANLQPGELLTLRYDLRPGRTSDATASITLKTRADASPSVDPLTTKVDALAMCLPGYRLCTTQHSTPAFEALLRPGHAMLSLAPDLDRNEDIYETTSVLRARIAPTVRLPLVAPWSVRIDHLLESMLDGGRCVSLAVDLKRICLGSRDIKLIARSREALLARHLSLPPEGPDTGLVSFQLAILKGWAAARSGVNLSFRLGFDAPPESMILSVASNLLFCSSPRPRLSPVDEDITDLDLTLAVASTMPSPKLLPPAAQLDRLGFFSRRRWRERDRAPHRHCTIGKTLDGISVSLAPADLSQHLYIVGATGVGKSTLMAKMIQQDIANGLPCVVIDPHGDLFNDILENLSETERHRACVADLSAASGDFGLNLLEMSGKRPEVRLNFVCNQLIGVFRKVLYRDQPEGFGPMFESYFRNALMLLVLGSPEPCSLSNFDRVFGDPKYRSELLAECNDEMVCRFWKQTAVRAGGEASLENIAPYIVSKLTQFTGSPLIRPVIDGSRRSVNFEHVFNGNGILLVNLAKGVVGEADASLVGALFSIDLFSRALSRGSLGRHQRPRVRLYLDEFQTYATDVLSQMLAECRKFGVELVLANQSLSQVSGVRAKPDVADSILANVGTVLAFRTGPPDARLLEEWFAPSFDSQALMRLRNHNFVARLLQNGSPLDPFEVVASCGSGDRGLRLSG